jgi:hypothetical protein
MEDHETGASNIGMRLNPDPDLTRLFIFSAM